MANKTYEVTLSTQNNTGDLYDIFYTYDGQNYFIAAGGVFMAVGQSVNVTVPDNSCTLKIVPSTGVCEGASEALISVGVCATTTTTQCPDIRYYAVGNVTYENLNDLGSQAVNWNSPTSTWGNAIIEAGGSTTQTVIKNNFPGQPFSYFGSQGNEAFASGGSGSVGYCFNKPQVWTFQGLAGTPGFGPAAGHVPLDIQYYNTPSTTTTFELDFPYPQTRQITAYGPVFMYSSGGSGNYPQYKVLSVAEQAFATTTTTTASGLSNFAFFGIAKLGASEQTACNNCAGGGTALFWTGSFGVGTPLFTDSNRTQDLLNANYVVNCNCDSPVGAFGSVYEVNSIGGIIDTTGTNCCD
jgi:hypothetical protein